jgi:hypothetical protein
MLILWKYQQNCKHFVILTNNTKKTQITIIRNERRQFTIDHTEIKRISRECYEQLYSKSRYLKWINSQKDKNQ